MLEFRFSNAKLNKSIILNMLSMLVYSSVVIETNHNISLLTK